MISGRVNLFDPRPLAIGSVILVLGIGGASFEGGNIPMFGWELPAIATSAVAGIILNLIFVIFDRGAVASVEAPAPVSEAPGPRTYG